MNIDKEDDLVDKLSQLLNSVVLVLKSDSDIVNIPFAGGVPSLKKRALDSIVEKFSTTFEKIDEAVKSVNGIASNARKSADAAQNYSTTASKIYSDVQSLATTVEKELNVIARNSVNEMRTSLKELQVLGDEFSGELTEISDNVHLDKKNIADLVIKAGEFNLAFNKVKQQIENLKVSIDNASLATSNKIEVFNKKYAELNANCDRYISDIAEQAAESVNKITAISQQSVKTVTETANEAITNVNSVSDTAKKHISSVSERLCADIDSKSNDITQKASNAVKTVLDATFAASNDIDKVSNNAQQDLAIAATKATESVLSKAGAVDDVAKKAIAAQKAVDDNTTEVERLATLAVVGMATEVLATQNVIVSFRESC